MIIKKIKTLQKQEEEEGSGFTNTWSRHKGVNRIFDR